MTRVRAHDVGTAAGTESAEPRTAEDGAGPGVGPARPAADGPVQELRAFSRFYTNLIGALDYSRHLYVPYTLTEARVLYELAHSPRLDAADLRTELSLDAGYLSRLLARFEKDELVERAPSERDPRRQSITLTGRGHDTAKLLDERSQEKVGALLADVPARDQERLAAAMRTIRGILSAEHSPQSGQSPAPRRSDVVLRPPHPGDLGWIVQRNAALYASEYGWNEEYETLVARIVADYAAHHDPRLERVWIAELDDRPVGCVMCVRDDHDDDQADHHGGTPATEAAEAAEATGAAATDTATGRPATGPSGAAPDRPGTARLRLLLVEPAARGLGVGDRLVTACIDFARATGYDDMVLWTNDILAAARRIYQRHGFTLTAEQPHHSFGADLTGQDWHLRLRD